MGSLAAYLLDRVPAGMSYDDAAQLCIRLYIVESGVPKSLLPLTKEGLGDAFAALSLARWVHEEMKANELSGLRYGAHQDDLSTRGHWLKVMRSILKKPDLYDRNKGEAVARKVGFVNERREGEPDASPNGGPAASFGNSGVSEGPPSVT